MSELYGKKIYELLKELNAIFDRNLKQDFVRWGLTAPQVMAISLLKERGAMKISEIAEGMGLADSNVSGIIDRLERAGLAERVRDREDRRIVRVCLTDKAAEIGKGPDSGMTEYFSQLTKLFSVEELENILHFIQLLRDRLEDATGERAK